MGNRGVGALAAQCRHLQSLNMSGAHRVTDVAIRTYAWLFLMAAQRAAGVEGRVWRGVRGNPKKQARVTTGVPMFSVRTPERTAFRKMAFGIISP